MKYRIIMTKQNKTKQKTKKTKNKKKNIYIFIQDNPVSIMTLVSMGVLLVNHNHYVYITKGIIIWY